METFFLIALQLLQLFLYIGGMIFLRKKFFTWHKVAVLRYIFITLYVCTFIPIITGLVATLKINFQPPCTHDCRGESLGLAIMLVVWLAIILTVFLSHIFFYVSIPAKKDLRNNLSEKLAVKWGKFKSIIFLLLFLTPIIAFLISMIHPTPPPNLP